SKLALPDKASPTDRNTKAKLKLGLFSYPVLQAADILVHGATHVPVGEDQVQHLEFARECANNFNSMHGTVLKEPQVLLSPAKRVMSLKEPHLKMSKSHEDPRSRILLTDSHVDVQRKIRLALTDSTSGVSYDPLNRPGVANLLSIMSHLDEQGRSCQELANLYSSMSMRDFKEEVTNRISESFAGIRARYDRIVEDEGVSRLEEVASTGAERAARNAQNTMIVVRDALGF
ncbi:Tryptophan--tRNA ligase, mitochondrial, partial [Lignoscripta atroalba]|nr:Tryptophan--tRNA ligase, mitochondrial [Lignoscripta atroalba]